MGKQAAIATLVVRPKSSISSQYSGSKQYKEIIENLPKPPKAAPNTIKHAQGQEHKAEAFADDLTIINTSQCDHQSSLLAIDSACRDLGLTLNSSKYIPLSLNNGRVDLYYSFQLT